MNMEDTYNIKAIILNKKPVRENDSRVTVYSREAGKLDLTARGTKKIKSKLAGHLEPFNLAEIMVVRGQRHNYAAAAVSESGFKDIKNNLDKLTAAGRALKITDQLIKPGVADAAIFDLLADYLKTLEQVNKDCEILTAFLIFKLLSHLGHKPELSFCVNCLNKIQAGKNKFDLNCGGITCAKCFDLKNINQLSVSDDAIKLLRLALTADFKKLMKVKIENKLAREVEKIINSFFKYNF